LKKPISSQAFATALATDDLAPAAPDEKGDMSMLGTCAVMTLSFCSAVCTNLLAPSANNPTDDRYLLDAGQLGGTGRPATPALRR
jgi:hypothetical protein